MSSDTATLSKSHEHWTGKVGFILSTAGSAIGLGSLWRFPYIAGQNGGGAFVILYLLFTFIIGVPVFLAELTLGRKTQKSSLAGYSKLTKPSSNWRLLGWVNILTCALILSFYGVVSGWCLSYTLMSLNQFSLGKSPEQIREVFTILSSSPGISLLWFALFLIINGGIINSGIRKGIEHWSKILMPALFIILIAMFFYSITLSGFGEAVRFVFYPDFSKLSGGSVLNALGMAFFTLSVGLGILITYGSYMRPKENIPYNGFWITLMTVFVSLMAALTIFPIVFTYGMEPTAGSGLVFQTLPIIFAKIPAGLLISTVFFALLLFAALTSTISLLEVLVANILENYSWSRAKATTFSTLLIFIIGIPSALAGSKALFPTWSAIYGKDFFSTVDYLTASWLMPLSGLCVTILAGWKLKKCVMIDEFSMGTNNKWLGPLWYFLLKWLAPLAVIVVILQEAGILKFN